MPILTENGWNESLAWITKARFWKFYSAKENDMPNSQRMGRHNNADIKNNLVCEFLIERYWYYLDHMHV